MDHTIQIAHRPNKNNFSDVQTHNCYLKIEKKLLIQNLDEEQNIKYSLPLSPIVMTFADPAQAKSYYATMKLTL